MAVLRFSELLKSAMDSYGVGPTKLEELLKEKGIDNISNKRISEYIRMVSTPGLEKAKEMMKVLEYEVDEDELKASLKENREMIKINRMNITGENDYAKTKIVNIRLRKIMPGQDTIDTELAILNRVYELYGDQDIVRYVEHLIADDLSRYEGKEKS